MLEMKEYPADDVSPLNANNRTIAYLAQKCTENKRQGKRYSHHQCQRPVAWKREWFLAMTDPPIQSNDLSYLW